MNLNIFIVFENCFCILFNHRSDFWINVARNLQRIGLHWINDVHAAIKLLKATSPAAKRLAPSAPKVLWFSPILSRRVSLWVSSMVRALSLEQSKGVAITSLVITTSPQLPTVCKRVCNHSDT